MLDQVSFEGVIETISTNHAKHKCAIKVSGDWSQLSEIESQALGTYHRIKTPVAVVVTLSDTEHVEFTAFLGNIDTNWSEETTRVAMVVDTTILAFEGSAKVMGRWAEKETKVGFRIEAAQKELL
jgi:precorrin-4 methylase